MCRAPKGDCEAKLTWTDEPCTVSRKPDGQNYDNEEVIFLYTTNDDQNPPDSATVNLALEAKVTFLDVEENYDHLDIGGTDHTGICLV